MAAEFTVHFKRTKDMTTTVKFVEEPTPGERPILGHLYLTKAQAGMSSEVTVHIRTKP